jgi:hypothetical protein
MDRLNELELLQLEDLLKLSRTMSANCTECVDFWHGVGIKAKTNKRQNYAFSQMEKWEERLSNCDTDVERIANEIDGRGQ